MVIISDFSKSTQIPPARPFIQPLAIIFNPRGFTSIILVLHWPGEELEVGRVRMKNVSEMNYSPDRASIHPPTPSPPHPLPHRASCLYLYTRSIRTKKRLYGTCSNYHLLVGLLMHMCKCVLGTRLFSFPGERDRCNLIGSGTVLLAVHIRSIYILTLCKTY